MYMCNAADGCLRQLEEGDPISAAGRDILRVVGSALSDIVRPTTTSFLYRDDYYLDVDRLYREHVPYQRKTRSRRSSAATSTTLQRSPHKH